MGFLAPKSNVSVVEQKAAPSVDDAAVQRAGEDAARRAAANMDSTDTIRTGPMANRRRGGLAQVSRAKVGGSTSA